MRFELVDVRAPRAADESPLGQAVAALVAESPQAGEALEIGLEVANPGAQPLTVLNPFEMVQFMVRPAAGPPLRLPAKAPSLLVNRKGRPWTFDSPFPIQRAFHNGLPVALEELAVEALPLAPREHWLAVFALGLFLDEAGAAVSVPDGIYAVRASMALINAAARQESRNLQSDEFEVAFTARRQAAAGRALK